jgi:chromosome partitioning protein
MILSSVLEKYKEDYDYVIIDCMPALGMLTINALTACDSVLIPATAAGKIFFERAAAE